MDHRTRVRMALNHQEPDRVPIDIGGTFLSSAETEMQAAIADVLGLTGEPDPRFPRFDDRIQRHFGCDLRSITPAGPRDWGYKEVHEAPLRHATREDLESYPWPGPRDDIVAGVREEARWLREKTDYFICAAQVGIGIFETGCYLRGYDQILLDMASDEDFVRALNDKILETNVRLGNLYFPELGDYVDMILIGDDLAIQSGPYTSPDMFRRLVKPWFAEYVSMIRRHCPNAVIAHHCCGSSWLLLDDLIEIGVQVINPVQTRAASMSPENLATKKGRLGFHGGVDLQHVLPWGDAAEVEEFVRDLIRHLAPGGDYILAACHTLPDDVKPENVVTMLEAALKWGRYPISC